MSGLFNCFLTAQTCSRLLWQARVISASWRTWKDCGRFRKIWQKTPEELVDRAEPEIRLSEAPGKIDRIRVDYALIESLLARSQEIMLLDLVTLPPLTQDQISAGLGSWINHYISMLKGLYFQLAQLRLMPVQDFGELFAKTIRDLAKSYNRDVTLEMWGGEIEVDIGLMDRLREPFMHLLRNAVAHGIEPSDEQEKSGKAREGKIVLEADRRGDQLILTISDDGRGLDARGHQRVPQRQDGHGAMRR